ncbi:MAG: outer membrane lipoprotein-sorting protein [Myxococcota bacterium]
MRNVIVCGCMVVVAASEAGAANLRAQLTAQQIVDKSLERNAFGFENAIGKLTLTLISKRGTVRQRVIEIRSRAQGKLGKTLVRFHAPADIAGTGFLILERDDADDDQYLYLPALGKVKRITSSQRNQRFMGTDLTYADLESRNLRRATVKRLEDAPVGGADTYVISALPEDPKDSQYGKTISWIHKTAFVPLKVEFYDKKMKLLKTLSVHRLEKKEGRWVVMDSTIKNVQAGTKTRMLVDSIDFEAKLTDNDFTQRALAGG